MLNRLTSPRGAHDPRLPHRPRARTLLVVLAASALLALPSCSPNRTTGERVAAATSLSSDLPPARFKPAVETAGSDGSASVDAGTVIVAARPGVLSESARIGVSSADAPLPDVPDWIVPAADPIDVQVEGHLLSPLTLTFAVTPLRDPVDTDVPVVLHLDRFGRWAVEAAELDGDRSFVVDADTFSVRMPAWLRTAGRTAAELADFAVDELLLGRSDPLGCDPAADSSDETVAAPQWADLSVVPSGEVHMCLVGNVAADGEIRAEVQIKSNRPTYLLVRLPPGASYVWVEGQDSVVGRVTAGLFGWNVGERVLLGPGKTMTAGYVRPAATSQSFDVAVETNSLTISLFLISKLVGALPDRSGVILAAMCIEEMASLTVPADIDEIASAALSCVQGLAKSAAGSLDASLLSRRRQLIADGLVSSSEFDATAGQLSRLRGLARVAAIFEQATFVLQAGALVANEALAADPAARTAKLHLQALPAATSSSSASTTTAAATTTAARSAAPSWPELAGASIPSLCGHPPATLVDGVDVSLGERDGVFFLNERLADGSDGLAVFEDLDPPLSVAVATCNAGGVAWPHQLLLFAPGPTFVASSDLNDFDWAAVGAYSPARQGVNRISAAGDRLIVDLTVQLPSDPACCPKGRAEVSVAVSPAGLRIDDVQLR